MEQVIDIYEKSYDPDYPVISFDERPCQLLDDVLSPVLPSPGKIKKEDYHYKRNGTCCILMAIEPLTGNRIVEIRERRTKKDYKEFFEKIYENYPKAKKITIIQDNLNTHTILHHFTKTWPLRRHLSSRIILIWFIPQRRQAG